MIQLCFGQYKGEVAIQSEQKSFGAILQKNICQSRQRFHKALFKVHIFDGL